MLSSVIYLGIHPKEEAFRIIGQRSIPDVPPKDGTFLPRIVFPVRMGRPLHGSLDPDTVDGFTAALQRAAWIIAPWIITSSLTKKRNITFRIKNASMENEKRTTLIYKNDSNK